MIKHKTAQHCVKCLPAIQKKLRSLHYQHLLKITLQIKNNPYRWLVLGANVRCVTQEKEVLLRCVVSCTAVELVNP